MRILTRLFGVGRRFGTTAALLTILAHLGRCLLDLDAYEIGWLDVADLKPLAAFERAFKFRALTATEVRKFAADPTNDLPASMADLIDRGTNCCLAALKEGRLIAYGWYALRSIPPEHAAGVGLTYPGSVAYGYKAFTHPDFRGLHIHPAIMAVALRYLQERHVRSFVSLTSVTNWPCLRSCRRVGYRPRGYLVRMQVFGRALTLLTPGAHALGITFGARPVHYTRRPMPAPAYTRTRRDSLPARARLERSLKRRPNGASYS